MRYDYRNKLPENPILFELNEWIFKKLTSHSKNIFSPRFRNEYQKKNIADLFGLRAHSFWLNTLRNYLIVDVQRNPSGICVFRSNLNGRISITAWWFGMGSALMTRDLIASKIYFLRGERILLDYDLANLYGVETKQLKRQVRRNMDRFPVDFMFQLNREEYAILRSQIGTLKRGEHTKYLPYAFTDHGVAMLSSILSSKSAIQANITIIRAFIALRKWM